MVIGSFLPSLASQDFRRHSRFSSGPPRIVPAPLIWNGVDHSNFNLIFSEPARPWKPAQTGRSGKQYAYSLWLGHPRRAMARRRTAPRGVAAAVHAQAALGKESSDCWIALKLKPRFPESRWEFQPKIGIDPNVLQPREMCFAIRGWMVN